MYLFFFSSRRRHTRCSRDWSSDVCSSDLNTAFSRNQTDKGFTNNDNNGASITYALAYIPAFMPITPVNGVYPQPAVTYRSEERRVGKECRSRRAPEPGQEK